MTWAELPVNDLGVAGPVRPAMRGNRGLVMMGKMLVNILTTFAGVEADLARMRTGKWSR